MGGDDYVIDGDLAFSNKSDALKFYQEQYHKKKKWQGLTDEERLRCFDDVDWNKVDWCPDHEQYAKAIEAKLKEKNGG
jgi:hypothetical protein